MVYVRFGLRDVILVLVFFFFNDTATTEIYTLSYTTLFRSLVDLVEDDDGVVEREPQDGQEADHGGRRHLEADQRVDAGRHDDVVHQRGHGADGHLRLEPHRQEQHHRDEEHRERDERLVGDVAAPLGAHRLGAHLVRLDSG